MTRALRRRDAKSGVSAAHAFGLVVADADDDHMISTAILSPKEPHALSATLNGHEGRCIGCHGQGDYARLPQYIAAGSAASATYRNCVA